MLPSHLNLDRQIGSDQTKRKLYEHLQDIYYLPPCDSRGVNRAYLDQVKMQSVFVVDRWEMARFLAELTHSQLKRVAHTSKYEAYAKVERLLAERQLRPLGFKDGLVPDGMWIYNVARYLDQENVAGLFQTALKEVTDTSRDSEKVFKVQQNLVEGMLEQTQLGKRSPVKRCIEDLHFSYRKVVSRLSALAAVTKYKGRLEQQARKDQQDMNHALEAATITVFHLQYGPQVQQAEGQPESTEKDRIREALRLVYTVDSVLRRDDEIKQLVERFVG